MSRYNWCIVTEGGGGGGGGGAKAGAVLQYSALQGHNTALGAYDTALGRGAWRARSASDTTALELRYGPGALGHDTRSGPGP